MASAFVNTGIRFSRAVITVRGAEGVANAVNFYTNALSLNVIRHTDEFAELTCGVVSQPKQQQQQQPPQTPITSCEFRLSIKAVGSEALLCHGYSPMLSFDVDDLDSVIARCAQMGAHLDGPIQYPAHGKVASMRSPEGHMIGLYEPAV